MTPPGNSKKMKVVGVLEMIVLYFGMQVENNVEYTNAKCHVFTLMINSVIIVSYYVTHA